MLGGNKKVTHTSTHLLLSAAGLCKCVTFLLPPGIKGLRYLKEYGHSGVRPFWYFYSGWYNDFESKFPCNLNVNYGAR